MRTLVLLTAFVAVGWSTVWCASTVAAAPFFIGLGDLPGGTFNSSATSVSADGLVVVGSSSSASGGEAFRWTQGGGMVGLGDLAGGPFGSSATGLSADGSVVVGSSAVETASSHGEPPFRTYYRAFRWTQSGGMVSLGLLSNSSDTTSFGYAVSANGSVTVGMSGVFPIMQAVHGEAFRRTQGGAKTGLGVLPDYDYSDAWDVSADGSVIVGRSWSGARQFLGGEAFLWTQNSGMVSLGDLAGGTVNSRAYGISADGAVVVGRGNSASGTEAFRWTQGSGMVGLGDLPGGIFSSTAVGIAADGSVIVGQGNSVVGTEAFLWDTTHGMRSLRDVFVSDFGLGASLAGWTLTSANDISADGQFIVGSGTNPSGNTEAWIARLSPQPALPGDFNNNGTVGPEDYDVWKANFGSTTLLTADGNGDGRINAADYTVWRNNLGASLLGSGSAGASPSHAAVPEPGAEVLFVLGMALIASGGKRVARRRKRQS
jgi:probable HAF family extracellular repeat protein